MIKHFVGSGYRQLSENEIVQAGDEFWFPREDRWRALTNPKASIGNSVKTLLKSYPNVTGFRRKIEADAFSTPVGYSVQPYPKFVAAERLDSGDLVAVDASGKLSKYRRPSPAETASSKAIWGKANFVSSDFTPSSWQEIDKAYAKKVGASLGSCQGYPVSYEAYAYEAESKCGRLWTYSYKGIRGYPVVCTTFDVKILPIGTRLRIHEGKLYRPLTQYDDPKDYRDFWIKENGTDEFERITWYDKTGINGDTFDNLFHNYVFEGGSLIGKVI